MVVPMMFREEDFTEQAREAIGASYDVVRRFRHPQWDVEHVMLALLENASMTCPSSCVGGGAA